jgi:xylulokinase
MRWFNEQFGYEERLRERGTGTPSLALLDRLAETVAAGSDGVVFLPYMAGERSPIWDEKAKGVFYGLDYSRTRAHMLRAVMEGVAYSLRHNLDAARGAGAQVGVLRAMGGAANSQLWTQMKADVTGKPIEVPASDTASTLGAALLVGVGVGLYKDFDEAVNTTVRVKRRHEPDQTHRQAYDRGYETYIALYQALKDLMDR